MSRFTNRLVESSIHSISEYPTTTHCTQCILQIQKPPRCTKNKCSIWLYGQHKCELSINWRIFNVYFRHILHQVHNSDNRESIHVLCLTSFCIFPGLPYRKFGLKNTLVFQAGTAETVPATGFPPQQFASWPCRLIKKFPMIHLGILKPLRSTCGRLHTQSYLCLKTETKSALTSVCHYTGRNWN